MDEVKINPKQKGYKKYLDKLLALEWSKSDDDGFGRGNFYESVDEYGREYHCFESRYRDNISNKDYTSYCLTVDNGESSVWLDKTFAKKVFDILNADAVRSQTEQERKYKEAHDRAINEIVAEFDGKNPKINKVERIEEEEEEIESQPTEYDYSLAIVIGLIMLLLGIPFLIAVISYMSS